MNINDEGYVTLMDNQGVTREDLRLPDETEDDEELCQRIREANENGKNIYVTVLSAMNIEKII